MGPVSLKSTTYFPLAVAYYVCGFVGNAALIRQSYACNICSPPQVAPHRCISPAQRHPLMTLQVFPLLYPCFRVPYLHIWFHGPYLPVFTFFSVSAFTFIFLYLFSGYMFPHLLSYFLFYLCFHVDVLYYVFTFPFLFFSLLVSPFLFQADSGILFSHPCLHILYLNLIYSHVPNFNTFSHFCLNYHLSSLTTSTTPFILLLFSSTPSFHLYIHLTTLTLGLLTFLLDSPKNSHYISESDKISHRGALNGV
ncbi:hypothetical protein E2C01_069975 [Portunus trituberculatus]|uniref:Uncharacterized protein n=1 Tax=Portunus trituberculatus TaxID=210409 RepID=A0A5B7I0D5_PORTR|nr:hypothetical protein [Portunus trituberculatus]